MFLGCFSSGVRVLTASPGALRLSPRSGWLPVGCFCAERPPLFLIFLSSLWDGGGTTPSLAPEPQASPRHQTAAPHWTLSLSGWMFRVCQSALEPECVCGRNRPGRRSVFKCILWVVSLALPHKPEPEGFFSPNVNLTYRIGNA